MELLWVFVELFLLGAPFVLLIWYLSFRPRNEGNEHGGGVDGAPPYVEGGG
jgi:hypothetical protein